MGRIENLDQKADTGIYPGRLTARLFVEARRDQQGKFFDLDEQEYRHSSEFFTNCGQYMAPNDLKRVNDAWALMFYAHQNQERESGGRYTNHCLRVATTLSSMRLEPDTIIAGLLHDVLEDSADNGFPVDSSFIRIRFGADVERLVLGCRNAEWDVKKEEIIGVEKMTPNEIDEEIDRLTQLKIYKQFSGLPDTDPRIIFIKIADRLDNMRTIMSKRSALKRQAKAVETLEFTSNLAKLLGWEEERQELSDLSFEVINPAMYNFIVDTIYKLAGLKDRPDVYDTKRYHKVRQVFAKIYQIEDIREKLRTELKAINLDKLSDYVDFELPSVFALHQTWIDKDKEGRFSNKDLYLKVNYSIPDEMLEFSTVSDIVNKISLQFLNSGWRVITDGKRSQNSHDEVTVFLQDPTGQRIIKFKFSKESTAKFDATDIANIYQIAMSFKNYAVINPLAYRKLIKLGGDYQLAGIAGVESKTSLARLRGEIGGIRIQGTKTGEYTVLRKGATVLEYAFKVRGGYIVHLTGFSLNKGTKIYGVKDIHNTLNDNDIVELFFNDKIDPKLHVNPTWLYGESDPYAIRTLANQIRNGLQYWRESNSITYGSWVQQIKSVGLSKITRLLKYRPPVVNIQVVEPLYQAIGFQSEDDFLQAVCFGELNEVKDLLPIADAVDQFTQSHFALDFSYRRGNNTHSIFLNICKKCSLQPDFFQWIDSGDSQSEAGRYFFPVDSLSNFVQLVEELGKTHDSYGKKFLVKAVRLIGDHLSGDISGLVQSMQERLEEKKRLSERTLQDQLAAIYISEKAAEDADRAEKRARRKRHGPRYHPKRI